jgi:hypothetical protein
VGHVDFDALQRVASGWPLAEDGLLVSGQHLRIIDRAVMMHLPPSRICIFLKDATGAKREFHCLCTNVEFTSFTSDYIEQNTCFEQRVVVELESIGALAIEQLVIGCFDLAPAALDSS